MINQSIISHWCWQLQAALGCWHVVHRASEAVAVWPQMLKSTRAGSTIFDEIPKWKARRIVSFQRSDGIQLLTPISRRCHQPSLPFSMAQQADFCNSVEVAKIFSWPKISGFQTATEGTLSQAGFLPVEVPKETPGFDENRPNMA